MYNIGYVIIAHISYYNVYHPNIISVQFSMFWVKLLHLKQQH